MGYRSDFFFFFQAEDGIRDYKVTGVQTCALPICASRVMSSPLKRMVPEVGSRNLVSRLKQVVLPAPLGPIKAWMEPRRTERSTLLTAVNPLNSLVRFRVSRITSLMCASPAPLMLPAANASPEALVGVVQGRTHRRLADVVHRSGKTPT